MHDSKALIISRGPTALRLRLKMTQAQFAALLNISKSTVSMVEKGHRHLPVKASKKIAELEAQLLSDTNPLTLIAEQQPDQRVEKVKVDRALLLSRATYQWERKTQKRNELNESLQQLKILMNSPGNEPGTPARKVLEHQHFLLTREWRKCDDAMMLKLEGKMEGFRYLMGKG